MEKKIKTKILLVAAAVLAIAFFIGFRRCSNEEFVKIERNSNISPTPNIITEMKNIGKWEFLSVGMEELIDTTKGVLFKNKLSAVYYGKLSYGIDFDNVKENWFVQNGDTVCVFLPKVTLLNDYFLDEAATKTVFESGSFSSKDKEDMRDRAIERMLAKGDRMGYRESAQENAKTQISIFLNNLGINNVVFMELY